MYDDFPSLVGGNVMELHHISLGGALLLVIVARLLVNVLGAVGLLLLLWAAVPFWYAIGHDGRHRLVGSLE
ncbi:MAG: hypothetical protein L3K11_08520 [Thermoplasmata archaeon]|nr:hypothetical protein [Thermoplasmata archaeon]